MPPQKPAFPLAADPKFGDHFDAWNSSATGHQRAENQLSGSIGWRQSRTMKWSHQFKSGGSSGKRISNRVGAGSEDLDERAKSLMPKDVRQRSKLSVADMLVGKTNGVITEEEKLMAKRKQEDDSKVEGRQNRQHGIFDSLVIYVNGSTYPTISDHKLKHILAENGARLSIHLARRQVTHVILGKPAGTECSGAGGGLAGTKVEKEIRRIGGCGVKYVGVEWVIESMKAGKRLPEAQFSNLKIAPKGQQSVYSMFKMSSSTGSGGLNEDSEDRPSTASL